MKNAAINTMASGIVFLLFFNSKEVYSRQLFDTMRKAKNYAKKYGYTLHESLPESADEFINID
jgi:hypothetical protein